MFQETELSYFIFFLYFGKRSFLALRLIYFQKWNFIGPGLTSSYKKSFSYITGKTSKAPKSKFPHTSQKKIQNKFF